MNFIALRSRIDSRQILKEEIMALRSRNEAHRSRMAKFDGNNSVVVRNMFARSRVRERDFWVAASDIVVSSKSSSIAFHLPSKEPSCSIRRQMGSLLSVARLEE